MDILGYRPDEIIGRSCFEYFHPDEVPFARGVHSRGIQLDKAAVLHYARIRGRDGQWIGCECVFTIVHEVLVACTSIYRGDAKNERKVFYEKVNLPLLIMYQDEQLRLPPFAVSLHHLLRILGIICWNTCPPNLGLLHKHHFLNLGLPSF